MTDTAGTYTDLSVGEILRRVRLQHNLSLAQVEDHTRINVNYLEALETGHFESLPGQVYVVGFVKTYSDYLNLDADKMVQLLKRQTGHRISRPVNVFPVVNEEQQVPGLKTIIVSTVVLCIILLGWKLGSSNSTNDEIPSVPKDLAQQMTAPQKPAEPSQAPEAAKPKPHPLVLKAVQDVWLEIRDGGNQPIFSRVLKQGEEYWVPENAVNYKMTTGNAGGLDMVIEGVPFKAMGKTGEVRRNISLNIQDLKTSMPSSTLH